MRHKSSFCAAFAFWLVVFPSASCTELTPLRPLDDAQPAYESNRAGQPTTHSIPRAFDVSISVSETPQLGAVFMLTAKVVALNDGREVHVALFSGDFQAAGKSGSSAKVGDQIPSRARVTRQLARGATAIVETPVTLSDPSRYRFIAVARATHSAQHALASPFMERAAVAVSEILVDIDSLGSRIIRDVSIIETAQPMSAPHVQVANTVNSVFDLASSSGGCVGYSGYALYVNADAEDTLAILPVAHARVAGKFVSTSGSAPDVLFSTFTSESGTFSLPPHPGYRFEGAIRLENENVFVRYGGTTYAKNFIVADACGGDEAHVLSLSAVGKVWSIMAESALRAQRSFQFSRELLRVDVAGSGAAFYDTDDDRVQFAPDLVWADDGTFLLAHEYGHAFHVKALLASETNPTCTYHALTSAHSLQCAYFEGFANFFSSILFSEVLRAPLYTSYVERSAQALFPSFGLGAGEWCLNQTKRMESCPLSNVTDDGALAEFAVAGFLYDLADNEETPNGSPGIDDDWTRLPLQWIGDVIRTCEVLEAGVWRRADGVDHLIYCFGRTLGTFHSDGYFPTRGNAPSDWRATSSTPVDWRASNIRVGWQSSLFVYGPPTQ